MKYINCDNHANNNIKIKIYVQILGLNLFIFFDLFKENLSLRFYDKTCSLIYRVSSLLAFTLFLG